MNRRSLFQAAVAALTTTFFSRPKPRIQPPWTEDGKRRRAENPDDEWSDFRAFEDWVDKKAAELGTHPPGTPSMVGWLDHFGTLDKIGLYAMFRAGFRECEVGEDVVERVSF
jgi:hypothetical protein